MIPPLPVVALGGEPSRQRSLCRGRYAQFLIILIAATALISHANAKESCANSIAHDFAVLPKSLHTTPLTSIAQELADLPKSVHTVPVGRGSTLLPALPAPAQQAIAAAPTPALLAARVAAHQADPATLPSHAKSVDVCARYGGHRLDFMRGHHAMWKCVYRTRRQWVASGR